MARKYPRLELVFVGILFPSVFVEVLVKILFVLVVFHRHFSRQAAFLLIY